MRRSVSTPSAVTVRPRPWASSMIDLTISRLSLDGDRVVDEEAVDLDFGERQLAKLHQGRIADPEIVHRQTDALDPEAGQRVHQLDQRLGRALGQFEHQPVGRHVERAAHPLDQVGKIELFERQSAEMLKAMQVSMPRVAPLQPLAKRRGQAPLGQLVDQPVALGQRHEARRRHRPSFGIVPPHQRLDPLQAAVGQRHLGLVDHVQPMIDQRALEPVEQAEIGRADHCAGVIAPDWPVAASGSLPARRAGPAFRAGRPSSGQAPRPAGRRFPARGGRSR